MSEKQYPCPKCGNLLIRNGHTGSGRQRWACMKQTGSKAGGQRKAYCYSTTNPESGNVRSQNGKATPTAKPASFRQKVAARVLVVTAAQNATPIHQGFLAALETYCAARNAQLLVVPLRYKNPTSKWTASQANEERWAEEVQPYLFNQRKKLNDNLTLLGDLKIQPTAVRPLTGLEGFTHGESGIVGHTKLQFATVATPQNSLPKLMTTTGAVTVPNFTDSRAGKQGEFHHVLGAVIIEIENSKTFHMRHVLGDRTGQFIDLDWLYASDGVRKAPPAKALVFGDAHYRFVCPETVVGTFGPRGLVERLEPEALVWHDLLDAYAVSPHHVKNPLIQIAKHRSEFNNIEREVAETVAWLVAKSEGRTSLVVPSNHDDMLARWVIREDWRLDPENAEFYLQTALHMVRSAKMGSGGATYLDPFQYWVRELAGVGNVRAVARGESITIAGIELGLHGDKGPHGAKGSVKNLSRLGVKVISGHGHSPAIEEGHYRVGTMSRLNLEYNEGPSGWLNTHCSIDALGKRHLHHIIKGRYCLE